jgi:hypothetical protein
MSRIQSFGICVAAIIIIYFLMPGAPSKIMTNASGLANSFNQVGNSPSVLAAAAFPITSNKNGLAVMGPPTITVEQIEAVLEKYNSPARGHGKEIYDLGVKYGINPAICLAFFIHESSAGSNLGWAGRKADGTFTHNIGNIICAGYATCYKGHRDYPSWTAGIEDWYRLITREYIQGRGLSTIEEMLPIYCPVNDGCATDRYITLVNSMINEWKQGKKP